MLHFRNFTFLQFISGQTEIEVTSLPTFPTTPRGTQRELTSLRSVHSQLPVGYMTQLFGGRLSFGKTVNVHKTTDVVLTSYRPTVPVRLGRDGGGSPDADDLAGSEGGWGVPVQPVRQAGELGGEWSNRTEVESQPNRDYGRLGNPIKKLTLATG